ncbi:MAG: L-rhamnose mutarotase [Clostridiales bacterium]|nr:L-rhamnose mutarotase [Clostridiales bacterium]
MKRESCMLKIKPGMLMEIENAIRLQEENIQSALTSFGAMNASVWTVAGYLYIYAEFADENPKGLNDVLAPYNYDLSFAANYIAKPGEMRRMYHDIGIVREDKHLIRRRVFATHLKPDCAEEYYNRHKALIDARGDKISEGPESNFTIFCAKDEFIFGYCELVKSFDHEMTEEEKASTTQWETRQLEIMDWFTDDVDWITGEKHEKMKNLFIQKGYEA